jgi:hypothetical protein
VAVNPAAGSECCVEHRALRASVGQVEARGDLRDGFGPDALVEGFAGQDCRVVGHGRIVVAGRLSEAFSDPQTRFLREGDPGIRSRFESRSEGRLDRFSRFAGRGLACCGSPPTKPKSVQPHICIYGGYTKALHTEAIQPSQQLSPHSGVQSAQGVFLHTGLRPPAKAAAIAGCAVCNG